MAFYGKGLLAMAGSLEVAMHFLKSNSIVLCIGGELDGLTQLVLAELGSKIQTLHVLWD